jgi:hypothetical protein
MRGSSPRKGTFCGGLRVGAPKRHRRSFPGQRCACAGTTKKLLEDDSIFSQPLKPAEVIAEIRQLIVLRG